MFFWGKWHMDTQTHRHMDARTDKIPSSRAPVGAKKSKHKRCYFLFFELYIESQKKEVVDYFTSWHDRVRTELIFERFLAPKGAQEVSICDCSYHWSLKYFSSFVCLSSSQEFCSACSKWRPCIWRLLCLQYIYDSPNMIVLLDSFYWLNSDISFIHLR